MNKLLCFDIDGTLYTDEKVVPASAKLAIQQLQRAGYEVAIATGRGPFMFESLRQELNIDTYISFNGSVVVHNNEVIAEKTLPLPLLKKLYNEAQTKGLTMVFLEKDGFYTDVAGDHVVKESLHQLKLPYPALTETLTSRTKINQALLYCNVDEEAHFAEQFPELRFVRWHEASVDVLPGAGSKAEGIAELSRHVGLTINDVIAFGDGLNDIEMLREAGIGVAMANGKQEAKAEADLVTGDVAEDGIHQAIERLQLL
ncbi:hypothetical protein B0H94_102132 [Salsuginibacillus halophilus]|uniref:Cof subfamily protein (Haloacid dehalogenase superfamily)/HAD superfamily hydrolase (TIGR01484 family) n=1 Tax=Salsuginibacillus halophilus TaxID=517424 RepID=A0A2P8HXA2_9BACI|nr:Cof-type HAD-IIB family hydrolase [Salsuginibacillus halophilus]PSL50856.1 hypothetical protein B0H94_102132 [Salsuginibacillus halophilus]